MSARQIVQLILGVGLLLGPLGAATALKPIDLSLPATTPLPMAPLEARRPSLPLPSAPTDASQVGAVDPTFVPPSDASQFDPAAPKHDALPMTLERLVRAAGTAVDAPELSTLMRSYYHSAGMDVPGPDFGTFEQNATLTYTYTIGDINADGVADVGMNIFCVDSDACTPLGGTGIPPAALALHGQDPCGIPNRLFAVSGATGEILWGLNMSRREWNVTDPQSFAEHQLNILCPLDFVIGELPRAEGGNDLLLYRFAFVLEGINGQGVYLLRHEIRLLDHFTGRTIWSHAEQGTIVFTSNVGGFFMHADSFLVNPLLMVAPHHGTALVSPDTPSAVFLQGVGFDLQLSAVPVTLPGQTQAYPLLNVYHPREWAASYNVKTGKELWRNAATFVPQDGISQVPIALQDQPPAPFDAPLMDNSYWGHVPCCFDLTGDGFPDLTYTTVEWADRPLLQAGPHDFSAGLVLFNGSSGQRVWTQVLEPGTQRHTHEELGGGVRCYGFTPVGPADCTVFSVFLELLGDVNGDHVDDVLVHLVYFQEQYRHSLSVRDGKTGQELWRLDRPRDLAAVVLGDSDGDGGNDFLTIEWQDWEFPYGTNYHLANVSVLPITVYNGASGKILWTAHTATFNAPIDLITMYQNFKTGGLPDVNHDKVGDVPVDDPLFLPDLEVVHRQSYLNGRTGVPLFTFDDVGTFTFVNYAGDLTGDDVDDFVLLNGDILDLWLTAYDGQNGTAVWSHRILTPRVVDYLTATPRLRYHPLDVQHQVGQSTMLNFQFIVQTAGGFFFTASRYPQIATFGPNGTTPWSLPAFDDHTLKGWVPGVTSGVLAYHRLLDAAAKPTGAIASAKATASTVAPFLGLYGLTLLITLPVTKWAPWRRWRK